MIISYDVITPEPMLTFEHFCDRPLWAAAAGYDFNFIDCLSFAARNSLLISLKELVGGFLDTEIRDIWWSLLLYSFFMLTSITWPLVFWIYGFVIYVRCIKYRKKYMGSSSEVIQGRLRYWINEFDREQRRSRRK